MAAQTYRWLVDGPQDEAGLDPFDRHLFGCAIALAGQPLADGLGLPRPWLAELLARYFPGADALLGPAGDLASRPDAPEEQDLRDLLLEHRTTGRPEELWLAHIVARRSLGHNHLWQDLGLNSRAELGRLMRQNFRSLAELNRHDMKWKKFFYRELCRREGMTLCKAPHCGICSDREVCFGAERGAPLIETAHSDEVRPC